MDERPVSSRAQRKVREQIEKQERERLKDLFKKRMDLARNGTAFYREKKFKQALECYYQYLSVLEKWKNVKSTGLEPKHFDSQKDVAELLLLSGIYWDLAKLHDHYSKKDVTKLKYFVDQFVKFSKGMPYEHVCAELARKFLVNGTPNHRKIFKDAHIRLGGGKCFIATAVEEYCAPGTLPALREIRDERLSHSLWGRRFIRGYYFLSPPLARAILRFPESIQIKIANTLNWIAKK